MTDATAVDVVNAATAVDALIAATVATVVIDGTARIELPEWTAPNPTIQAGHLNSVHQPQPPILASPPVIPTPTPLQQTTRIALISPREARDANGMNERIGEIVDLAPIAIPDDQHSETLPHVTPLPASSPMRTSATALTTSCRQISRHPPPQTIRQTARNLQGPHLIRLARDVDDAGDKSVTAPCPLLRCTPAATHAHWPAAIHSAAHAQADNERARKPAPTPSPLPHPRAAPARPEPADDSTRA